MALQSVVITYGGWQSALYFAEEDRDPERNLPRSMIGGVASVIVVYLLVNLALLAVLPLDDLARSTLPAADAARILLGGRGPRDHHDPVDRLAAADSQRHPDDRHADPLRDGARRAVWRRAATVNARGTPAVATLATTAVALALIATGTFQRLVAIAAFFLASTTVVCCLALIVLRRREPDAPRPFRAWGYPWSVAVVLAGATAFLVGAVIGDAINATGAVILLAVGLVVRRVSG